MTPRPRGSWAPGPTQSRHPLTYGVDVGCATVREGRGDEPLHEVEEGGCLPHAGAGRDAGAGFVEYAGLMIIIAGIFVMIDQLGLDGTISSAIGDAVDRVVGGGG